MSQNIGSNLDDTYFGGSQANYRDLQRVCRSAHLHELVEGELAAVVLVKHPEQGLGHHTRLQHHRDII